MIEIHADSATKAALASLLSDVQDNAVLIYLESPDDSVKHLSDASGLDTTLEVLKQETEMSQRSVVICGFRTAADYAYDRRWHAVLAHPNVMFRRLPIAGQEFQEAIALASEKSRPLDVLGQRWLQIVPVDDQLRTLKHDLQHAQADAEEKMGIWEEKARQLFGDLSQDELIVRVVTQDVASVVPLFAGEEFPDACFDVEGTLLVHRCLRDEVVEMMKVEAKSRPITIWTGGDVKEAEKLLRKQGIAYKITSKYLFRNAKFAKVYDDMSPEEFTARYGIKFKQYVQV